MTATELPALPRAQARQLSQLADGLDVLIRFHDRELDAATLTQLDRFAVVPGLAGLMPDPDARAAVTALARTLEAIGPTPTPEVLDDLAADFADLYLTHGYRVSPSGSVWLTEDKLERQMPMFEVRDWYEHYGISVPDWRVRADDHLVHELQFLSFLCRRGNGAGAADAARFMDLHVLPWLPEFCAQAQARVRQPLYAAVMALSAAYLDRLRAALEEITGQPRDIRALRIPGSSRVPDPAPEDAPYMPGVAESW